MTRTKKKLPPIKYNQQLLNDFDSHSQRAPREQSNGKRVLVHLDVNICHYNFIILILCFERKMAFQVKFDVYFDYVILKSQEKMNELKGALLFFKNCLYQKKRKKKKIISITYCLETGY